MLHQIRRYGISGVVNTVVQLKALIVTKKESLVPDNWTTQRPTKLVGPVRGFRSGMPLNCIQHVIAEEFITGSMELIRTGFHNSIHLRTAIHTYGGIRVRS